MFLTISGKIIISFIKYNTVFWFQSEQDPLKRSDAKGTFSEQNNLTTNQGMYINIMKLCSTKNYA